MADRGLLVWACDAPAGSAAFKEADHYVLRFFNVHITLALLYRGIAIELLTSFLYGLHRMIQNAPPERKLSA